MAKKAKKKKIVRRPWSREDVRKFKALAREKVSAKKLAREFKRTVPALRNKAVQLGISLDSRGVRRKRKVAVS